MNARAMMGCCRTLSTALKPKLNQTLCEPVGKAGAHSVAALFSFFPSNLSKCAIADRLIQAWPETTKKIWTTS